MRVTIRPSVVRGTVTAPPSKSMAHRLLICAGLAEGESVVRNLAFSEDIKATIACLRSLGAEIRLDGDTAYIKGTDVTKPTGIPAILPCNESGSTLRFFIPLCWLSGEKCILTGTEYLMKRPLSVYEQIAGALNISFERHANKLAVEGKLRHSIINNIPGDISSQFITGLMFALPLLNGYSELHVKEPVESMPYIDMTLQALSVFGIRYSYRFDDEEQCHIWRTEGGAKYSPSDVTVEGDYSNAAFFEALNYMGSDVTVTGLAPDSLQGDKVYQKLFKETETSCEWIDISDCPDLGPILFAVAARAGGARFTGTRRLKYKESDRVAAMKEELKKFGIEMMPGESEEEDRVMVWDCPIHAPRVPLNGHNDHRVVMALTVLATVTGGVIEGAEAVAKSFPDFFDRLKDLGVDIEYGMDQ